MTPSDPGSIVIFNLVQAGFKQADIARKLAVSPKRIHQRYKRGRQLSEHFFNRSQDNFLPFYPWMNDETHRLEALSYIKALEFIVEE